MSDKITTFEQFKIFGNRIKTVIDNEIANLARLMASGLTDLQDIVMSGGVPYGKELTESWASLQTRIKVGNFSGIHIGDFKTISMTTGEIVIMEVAGIDQYYRSGDTPLGHHIDFISRDCLRNEPVGKFKFNDTNTNNGTKTEPNPWRASKLFKTMNDETTGIYAILPADLKSCIIEKKGLMETRFSGSGMLNNSTGADFGSSGKLWLPTEIEVFGSVINTGAVEANCGGFNKQYPIFIGSSIHLIKGDGNGGINCRWWVRSPRKDNSTSFCRSDAFGSSASAYASRTDFAVPLCFRIG